jgi:hypothetical protein
VARSNSLFKFRPFNKASMEIFVNRKLWFARPDSLNDPFECQFDFENWVDELSLPPHIPNSERIEIKKSASNVFNNLGVCSFSKTRNNLLMWSHYADEHKGFCIGFNETILSKSDAGIKAVDVKYQAETSQKSVFKSFEVDGDKVVVHLDYEAMHSIVGRKYTHWKYERERRLIVASSNAYSFKPESVVSITLGLKMPERDKDTLKQLLSSSQWSHLKWYNAKKVKGRFALDFVQVKI